MRRLIPLNWDQPIPAFSSGRGAVHMANPSSRFNQPLARGMMARLLHLALALALWIAAAGEAPARELQVTFINPGAEHAADLWEQMPPYMEAAAEQFGFRLEILYANRDRLRMVELARQVAARAARLRGARQREAARARDDGALPGHAHPAAAASQ